MANDNDKFVIQVSLDTTQAQEQLKKLNDNVKKNLTSVTDEIKTVIDDNGVSKTIQNTTKEFTQQIGNIKKTITEVYSDGKLKSSLTQVKTVNDQINNTLKNSGNFINNQLKVITGIGLGYLGVQSIISGVANLTQSGLQTTSFSQGFNTNTTILQEIEQLFKRKGGTTGEADTILANIYTGLTDIQGHPALSAFLNAVGLGNAVVDQRQGKYVDTGQLLLQIIDRLHSKFPNEAQRQGILSYGGFSSYTLRALVNASPKEIQSLLKQISQTVLTPSELAQQTDLAQRFQELGSAWKKIGATLLTAIYPVLKDITIYLNHALGIKDNNKITPLLDTSVFDDNVKNNTKKNINKNPNQFLLNLSDDFNELFDKPLNKVLPRKSSTQNNNIPPPVLYPLGTNNVHTNSMIQNKYHSNNTVHNNNKHIRIESLNVHGVNNPNEFATNLSNIAETGFAYSGGYLA